MFGVNFKLDFSKKADIIRRVGKANAENLMKAGAFVWKRARTIIKQGSGTSEPGDPPTAHKGKAGSPLRKLLLFDFDPFTHSELIGPIAMSGMVGAEALSALEKGGRSRRKKSGKPITIRKRPFMLPSLLYVKSELPAIWRDSVR